MDKFRLDYNVKTGEYNRVFKTDKTQKVKRGFKTVDHNCNVTESIMVWQILEIDFGLHKYDLESIKTALVYIRKIMEYRKILRSNPDPNEKIEAFKAHKEGLNALLKLCDMKAPGTADRLKEADPFLFEKVFKKVLNHYQLT